MNKIVAWRYRVTANNISWSDWVYVTGPDRPALSIPSLYRHGIELQPLCVSDEDDLQYTSHP